jgi:hypothetical protein
MFKYVSPELYNQYKYQVLEMSPAIQYYEGTTAIRESIGLSDQEIADRLGMDVDDVTEIRCMAEIDLIPADTWIKSAQWKREQADKYFTRRKSNTA